MQCDGNLLPSLSPIDGDELSRIRCADRHNYNRVVQKAVERMVPRGPLGRQVMRKLKVYAGGEHPHEAQQPEVLDFAAMNPKNKR